MSNVPAQATRLVAIVGNPNAGKTTLFNSLTGSFQKVGNYPGVTVEKIEGRLRLPEGEATCIDVPGIYSLKAVSEDELVAVSVIDGKTEGVPLPDLLVCVVDAGNLERNLYLFCQLAEMGRPMVVALTMTDRLKKSGKKLDLAKLTNLLGVDVIPVVGHKNQGLKELREAIDRNLEQPRIANCDLGFPVALETKVAALRERMARAGIDFSIAEVRRALLNPLDTFEHYLHDNPELSEAFEAARDQLCQENILSPNLEITSRYQWSEMVQRAVLSDSNKPAPTSFTDRVDRILTHRVFGLLIFVGLMYLVFQSIYTFAGPMMDGIESVFGVIQHKFSVWLAGVPIIQALVVDGIIGGVGAMLVFLPQILILFFFIAVLEGTGYLARAAFLMDRLLGWCGLSGRAFIPLLSSFACAIPGIMAARVMPDQKSRLATILVAPLMSCSARLPVYVLLIGAFIEPVFGTGWAGFALFAMHFLGLIVAIPIVWILNRKVLHGKRLPFLLELPPYQMPVWRDVWLAMWFRGKVFVQTAGTIIVVLSIVIWGLSYFPRSQEASAQYRQTYLASHPSDTAGADNYESEEQLKNSYLGRFGQSIEPVFRPAGFDWRITTSILAAFPAREMVVPSLGILFQVGGDVDNTSVDLRNELASAKLSDGGPLLTPWTAVGLMVFFALCCQCMATLAAVRRETNSVKWPVFMFTYMTLLAYLGAVGIHQLSKLF